MKPNSIGKQIGCIFLIMGTEIGAGVLALPILIVHVGVYFGALILIFAWALMLYTALLCCEANNAIEGDVSFATMALKFLGKSAKIFMTVVFWITLSSIAMAYISAAGSTFSHITSISVDFASIIFVIIFGLFVIIGTATVDYVNRILLTLKLMAFVVAISMLFYAIKRENLDTSGSIFTIISSFPAIITAFILHNIIPTIRTYLNYDAVILRRVVIIGSLIPLIIYILWVITIIGNIPAHGPQGFDVLFAKGKSANVGDLLALLSSNTKSYVIMSAINCIAIISVTTSFLGTSISLYHFVRDAFGYSRKNALTFYAIPILLTFLIPLFIVLVYPDIFILTLGYAGMGATILFALIPILIVRKILRSGKECSIRWLGNPWLMTIAFILGLGVIFIELFLS